MRLEITTWATFTTARPTRTTVEYPDAFTEFECGPDKKQLKGWSPALYPLGVEHKRQENIGPVNALVLDYDGEATLESILDMWAGADFVVHSTYSHGLDGAERYRVIIPYAPGKAPRTAQEHAQVWAWAKALDPRIDGAAKDVGRLYGWPARRPDQTDDDLVYVHVPGALFNPEDVGIEYRTPAPARHETSPLDDLLKAAARAARPPTELAADVEAGCSFMQFAKEQAAELTEPDWYAWLGVLSACKDGREYAHQIGSAHPGYSMDETDTRLERARNFGPTTCDKINSNYEGCASCPFQNKITSPIQIPRLVRSARTPDGSAPNTTSSPTSDLPSTSTKETSPKTSTTTTSPPSCSDGTTNVDTLRESNTPVTSNTPLVFPSYTLKAPDASAIQAMLAGVEAQIGVLNEALTQASAQRAVLKARERLLRNMMPEEVQEFHRTSQELDAAESELKGRLKRATQDKARLEAQLRVTDAPPGASALAWLGLTKDKAGPKATPHNIDYILRNDEFYQDKIWYDSFASIPYFRDRAMDETLDIRIMQDIERRYGVVFRREQVRDAVVVVAEDHARHPVREYLDGLKWDGVPRVGSLLTDGFGAVNQDDPELLVAFGQKFLISLVARIYEPGCKADNMLVLTGAQRRFKSTALRTLVSPPCAAKYGGWFEDNRFDPGDKDGLLLLQGKWLVEVGELDSFKGRESTLIKAFLSRQADRFRPPYGHMVKNFPRQFILAGTTNEQEFLRDSTGSLRFYAVEIERADLGWIAANRDQLWAEAVTLYRAGVPWWFERDADYDRLTKNNRRFETEHPWGQQITTWVRTMKSRRVSVGDILSKCLGIPTERTRPVDKDVVTGLLRGFGWTPPARDREMVNGVRDYYWTVPEEVFGVAALDERRAVPMK